MPAPPDPTLDVLLELDGQVLVVDPAGGHWVRFVVTRVPVSATKPHGLDYIGIKNDPHAGHARAPRRVLPRLRR